MIKTNNKVMVKIRMFNALEDAYYSYNCEELLSVHIGNINQGLLWLDNLSPLNDLSIMEMASIVINGYDCEMTPHEEVEYIYNCQCDNEGEKEVVLSVLSALGIEIEGVNK